MKASHQNVLTIALALLPIILFAPRPASGMYDARHGRWLQRDPARYVDGANLYEYSKGDPTGRIDPDGLASAPSLPKPEGPAPPAGTDCDIEVHRSPLCLARLNFVGRNLGHTWIVMPGGDTADFPPNYIEDTHKCQKNFVYKKWKTRTASGNTRSCTEISACLQSMENWWAAHVHFSIFGRSCRDFAAQALSTCGLDRVDPPYFYDKDRYKEYCCSPCGQMLTQAKYRHPE